LVRSSGDDAVNLRVNFDTKCRQSLKHIMEAQFQWHNYKLVFVADVTLIKTSMPMQVINLQANKETARKYK
jgi:hypothetical protein